MSSHVRRDLSRTAAVIRRVLAQVGSHPLKAPLFAMLLEQTDLPGADWKVAYEMASETGAGTSPTEEIRRARDDQSITVVRRLRSDAANRTLVLYLIPFVSHDDAQTYLPKSVGRLLRKPFSKVEVIQEGFVELRELSESRDVMTYEMQYVGPNGVGGERMVVSAIGELVLIMDFVAAGALWPWDEILQIASIQSQKIRTELSSREPC